MYKITNNLILIERYCITINYSKIYTTLGYIVSLILLNFTTLGYIFIVKMFHQEASIETLELLLNISRMCRQICESETRVSSSRWLVKQYN